MKENGLAAPNPSKQPEEVLLEEHKKYYSFEEFQAEVERESAVGFLCLHACEEGDSNGAARYAKMSHIETDDAKLIQVAERIADSKKPLFRGELSTLSALWENRKAGYSLLRKRRSRYREVASRLRCNVQGQLIGFHGDIIREYTDKSLYDKTPDSRVVNRRTGMKHLVLAGGWHRMVYPSGKVVEYNSMGNLSSRELRELLGDPRVTIGPRIHFCLPRRFCNRELRRLKGKRFNFWGLYVKFGDCSHPNHIEVEFSSYWVKFILRPFYTWKTGFRLLIWKRLRYATENLLKELFRGLNELRLLALNQGTVTKQAVILGNHASQPTPEGGLRSALVGMLLPDG